MWMEELREFLREPGRRTGTVESVQALYLDYVTRWHATPADERWDPNTTINALGVLVGDLVRERRPELAWRVVAGCRPTVLVLADDALTVALFPLSDVARAWMSRELIWMDAYVGAYDPAAAAATSWIPRRAAAR